MSVDVCRRIKRFFLDSRYGPIFCSCNCATEDHIGMRIFDFVVLSLITAPHNVLTPHFSKTHLPIVSLNVREVELNWCSKDQPKKKGGPPAWGWKPNSPRKALRFIKRSSLSLHRGMRLPNTVQSKQNFASDAWAEMSSNQLKWVQMSLNVLKGA